MTLTVPTLIALLGCGVAATMLAVTLPIRILALLWGALLPINATANVSFVVFAAAKLLLAVVLVSRCRAETEATPAFRWVVPLWIVGCLMFVDGVTTSTGGRVIGAFIIAAATIALAVCKRPSVFAPVLLGFAAGCCVNAAVLFMQVLEMPTIARDGPHVDAGRFAGLSVSAPFASIEFAVACVVLFCQTRREAGHPLRTRLVAAAGALTCVSAMLASGGRTGLVALTLGAVVAAYQGTVKVKHAAGIVAGIWLALHTAERYQLGFSTLERIDGLETGIGTAGLTSNRDIIFRNSLSEFLEHPALGPGYGRFVDTYGIMPHFAPLTFAVGAGVAGAAIGLYLLLRFAALALLRRKSNTEPLAVMAPPVAAILLVMTALEPEGPFMSIGLVTILCVCVSVQTESIMKPTIAPEFPKGGPRRMEPVVSATVCPP